MLVQNNTFNKNYIDFVKKQKSNQKIKIKY